MLRCGKAFSVSYGPGRNTTRPAVIPIGAKYLRPG